MAIIVPILTQFDDKGIKSAVREFERAKTTLGKFSAIGDGFSSIGKSLTRNVTLPLAAAGAGIFKLVQAGSTLQESISKTNAVFGANAQAVQKWSQTTSKAFGVSQQQALEAAGTYGNLFRAFGLGSKQAQDMSQRLVELAADMASFNNVPIDEALLALRSGLSGETEPLKRFGVALNEARLKEEALRLGLIETTSGTLPIAIKTQAAYSLILRDTALQQGDVARTSDGFAAQMKFLQSEVANVTAQLGSAFIPVMLEFINVIRTSVVPLVQRLSEFFKNLDPNVLSVAVKIGLLVAAIGPLLVIFGTLINSVVTFINVFKALNLAFLASPIGLVIAGLVALTLVVIRAWMTSDNFRQGVAKLGNALIGFVEGAINFVITGINAFIQSINGALKLLKYVGIDLGQVGEISEVALGRLKFNSVEAGNSVGALAAQTDTLGKNVSQVTVPAVDNLNTGLSKTAEAAKKAKEAAKDAAQVIVDKLEESLRKAESALEDVKGKFNNFKDAIASTISGILNFGKAAENENFLQGLSEQAAEATKFADKVKQLVVLGLNERAIREVLSAGFEAGSKIADQIIAGGVTIVNEVNALVDAVDSVANQVGFFGAETFYQAGVTQGEALVAGIKAALEAARADLKRITDSLTVGETTTKATNLPPGKKTEPIRTVLPPDETGRFGLNRFSRLAKGGIALGPTSALIGEAGPEAVIPLTGSKSLGMGTTYNIVVNAGIGTSGAQVGRDIVEAIQKYERTSGQVFARP